MTARLLIALVLVVVALAVAWVVQRRRPTGPPTQDLSAGIPSQLDRGDFARPEAPWLVAVFSSDTCRSCAEVIDRTAGLARDDVAVQAVSFQSARPIHERYGITAVPTTVIADSDGVVQRSFVGRLRTEPLDEALAATIDRP